LTDLAVKGEIDSFPVVGWTVDAPRQVS